MTNLGYSNGWNKTLEILKNCKHTYENGRWSETVGRCLTEYGCTVCDYKYTVDSSD